MKLRKGSPYPFLPRKGADMPQHIADFTKNQPGLAHIALETALAKIPFQRIVNPLLMFQDAIL